MVIAAATASGKTEAAFLPICSVLVSSDAPASGVRALYISPLKALINDQFRRLDELCEDLDIPVHRWHGDVAASAKARVVSRPDGVLLTTPESLEALFVLRGPEVARILGGLGWIVIDEMHSFMGTERGAQLRSLMHRVELALGRRVPRIGLSATLGDMDAAAEFLRPGAGAEVAVIVSGDDPGEAKLQLRGYLDGTDAEEETDSSSHAIAEHLYTVLRGKDNLVFVNRRSDVERYSDTLRTLSEQRQVPVEFWPHHGNLAKDVREFVEQRLKEGAPTTAVCTSTLEMGIDIGSVHSVAQLSSPPTVAALRQRLGRSGRRGEPSIMRVYVSEPVVEPSTPPTDQLRAELVQTIAMIDLLGDRWYEPPNTGLLHLSTLVQQVLSIIAQDQGATPTRLWRDLCGTGPFQHVDKDLFGTLLRDLGGNDLIRQESDGLLLLGGLGERIVDHYSFYAAFATAEEYRLVAGSRTLGTLPILRPVLPDSLLIFAGRRWRVLSVDARTKLIELTESRGGRAPLFAGLAAEISDEVRQRMVELYTSPVVPHYLDTAAQQLLAEGRETFRRLRLADTPALSWGNDTVLFPWIGDRALDTLGVLLTQAGLTTWRDGLALTISNCGPARLRAVISTLLADREINASDLAATVPDTIIEKYDGYLGDRLRTLAYASGHLDLPGALAALRRIVDQLPEHDTNPIDGTPLPEPGYAVLDLETTGLSPTHDRIVEIAVVLMDRHGAVTGEWNSLINPERSPGASHVHGLTRTQLRDAPTLRRVITEFTKLLNGRILVGHNVAFDLSFLAAEFARLERPLPLLTTVCTMRLDQRLNARGRRSLADCCTAADIPLNQRQHSALGDARLTANLFRHFFDHSSGFDSIP
ncbi:ATP-dependent Lhr-like helicase [Kutzneria viridogrisea]|uniref:ATP-dependent Lhr-like helicase n=1 Tax=Kutzneria viridogrisea TaxID=47990 RepID=A0ABR6BBJ9_9PSEU|nr:ATP-dependent Lhr-like helicase [Kutzneria viridogrisea]